MGTRLPSSPSNSDFGSEYLNDLAFQDDPESPIQAEMFSGRYTVSYGLPTEERARERLAAFMKDDLSQNDGSDGFGSDEELDLKFSEDFLEPGISQPFNLPAATNAAQAQAQVERNARYEVILEASTAAAQRIGEVPLTYLNKGQYYAVNLVDKRKADVTHTTHLRIRFHDPQHQLEKNENWRTWLMQQNARTARPMEVDKVGSVGIRSIDTNEFDTIRFQWNGARSAKVLVRFNCLSTEFSRTKGVKGINLRLQSDSEDENGETESCYCRIKVFRDKGAQRKNRDDQKAVEKKLTKLLRDNPDGAQARNALAMFAPSSPVTRFITDVETSTTLKNEHPSPSPSASSSSSPAPHAPVLADATVMPKTKSRKYDFVDIADLEVGTNLPPVLSRKKRPVLCVLLKTPDDPVYYAIFLERLTADDFKRKIAERYGLDVNAITGLHRISKKGLAVSVDDQMVENFEDEQDFVMESTFNNATGSITINLR